MLRNRNKRIRLPISDFYYPKNTERIAEECRSRPRQRFSRKYDFVRKALDVDDWELHRSFNHITRLRRASVSPTLLLRSNRMRGVLRRHQPRIRTPFLLPPSSRSHYPAGCINASSDMSTSSALQALNGAQMRACACTRVCGRGSFEDIHEGITM